MITKPAYQYDHAGLLIGVTEADESPLEPGVFLIPARCTLVPPPVDVPDDKWPRFAGSSWALVDRPRVAAEPSAMEKLQAFFDANPDVVAMMSNKEGASQGGV